jgi:AAHS family 4-hydroxybenzoate transporter-like MFS transporter
MTGSSFEAGQDATLAKSGKSTAIYRAAFLCFLVLVLEGYDLGAMSFTLPTLAETWHLKPAAFTTALVAGNVGLFIGSLLCGMLGDRLGRKPVLMGAVAIFGLMSMLTALTTNPFWLSLTRLLTGIGIGGGIPTTIALLSDLAPPKKQGGLVMATMCGVQAGNVVSGVAASRLIAHWGWPSVFVLGGLLPLLIIPALALWLPETFVMRTKTSLASIPRLFEGGFARFTLLLWLINFLSLLTI